MQKRFNDLPNGSITSSLQLMELFSAYFIASKRETKIGIHLAKIRQAKGEHLQESMMRFNRNALLILDLQDRVVHTVLSIGCFLESSNFPSKKA